MHFMARSLLAAAVMLMATPASYAAPYVQTGHTANHGAQVIPWVTPAQSDAGLYSRDIWREAQEALRYYGFDTGTPDGLPGPRTRTAISDYQSAQGAPRTGTLSRAEMGLLLERYRTDIAATPATPTGTGLPQPVSDEVNSIATMCEMSPDSLLANDAFLLRPDLNGDGVPDYVLDGAQSGCRFTCGVSNCTATVFASSRSGSLQRSDFLAPGVSADTFVCNADGTCRFRRAGEAQPLAPSTAPSAATAAADPPSAPPSGAPAPSMLGSSVLLADGPRWPSLDGRPSSGIGNAFIVQITHFAFSHEAPHFSVSAANQLDRALKNVTLFLVDIPNSGASTAISAPIGPAIFAPEDDVTVDLARDTPPPAVALCWEAIDARSNQRVIGAMEFVGQASTTDRRITNYAAVRPADPVLANASDRCADLTGITTAARVSIAPSTPFERDVASGARTDAQPSAVSQPSEDASHVLAAMNMFYQGDVAVSYPQVPPFLLDISHTTGIGTGPHYTLEMQSHLNVPLDGVRVFFFDDSGTSLLVNGPVDAGFFDRWDYRTRYVASETAADTIHVCWEGVFVSDGQRRVGRLTYSGFHHAGFEPITHYAAIPQTAPLARDAANGCGAGASPPSPPAAGGQIDLTAGLPAEPMTTPEHLMVMSVSYAANGGSSEPAQFMFETGNMNGQAPLRNVAFSLFAVAPDGQLTEIHTSRGTGQFIDFPASWMPTLPHPNPISEILFCWEHDQIGGPGRVFEAIPMQARSTTEPGGPELGRYIYEKTGATQVRITSDPTPCDRFAN